MSEFSTPMFGNEYFEFTEQNFDLLIAIQYAYRYQQDQSEELNNKLDLQMDKQREYYI